MKMIHKPSKQTRSHIAADGMPRNFYRKNAITKMRDISKVLLHPTMRQMYELISKGEISVTDIYVKLRLEQSVASQFLRTMRKSGLVTARREGKYVFYRSDIRTWDYVSTLLDNF